jgi:hypothetical protein
MRWYGKVLIVETVRDDVMFPDWEVIRLVTGEVLVGRREA